VVSGVAFALEGAAAFDGGGPEVDSAVAPLSPDTATIMGKTDPNANTSNERTDRIRIMRNNTADTLIDGHVP
jgi:hypothetical protein